MCQYIRAKCYNRAQCKKEFPQFVYLALTYIYTIEKCPYLRGYIVRGSTVFLEVHG